MDFSVEDLVAKIDKRIEELEQGLTIDESNLVNEISQKQKQLSLGIMDISLERKELNQLIGLTQVKEEIDKLINYLIFYKKIYNKTKLEQMNLNMIFKGNPGTGKTTIARIIGRMIYKMGYLSNNKFIETTPRDFIASYTGQTAIKTKKLLDEYHGGVIFIDEAYAFNGGKDEDKNSFAQDAITEILKEMEKNETVFIFSGYTKDMDNFLKLNPGLNSRISYNIEFPDYNEEELLEIFTNKINNSGFNIQDKALSKVKDLIITKKKEKNFGNGRMIYNLYNEILREHATININETDVNKLLTITEESISKINYSTKGGNYFA